ncbi:hypothetical protein TNCV_3078251 [Trichonephila clavipes]|nr:hypothetical protein TNCV_3078251 [Trichonephila clavipes]
MEVTEQFCSVPPQFIENPEGSQGLSPLFLPPTARDDLRLNSYLEYSHAGKTTIHLQTSMSSGIRAQSLRHRSQFC